MKSICSIARESNDGNDLARRLSSPQLLKQYSNMMEFEKTICIAVMLFGVAAASYSETEQVSMLNAENLFLKELAHGAALKAAAHGSALRGQVRDRLEATHLVKPPQSPLPPFEIKASSKVSAAGPRIYVKTAMNPEQMLRCFEVKWGHTPFEEGMRYSNPGSIYEDIESWYLYSTSKGFRTNVLADADVVFLLSFPILGNQIGTCGGYTHEKRQRDIFEWAKQNVPAHIPIAYPCTSWACGISKTDWQAFAKINATLLINERNPVWVNNPPSSLHTTIADESIVVPYTAHHRLRLNGNPTKVGTLFIGNKRHHPVRAAIARIDKKHATIVFRDIEHHMNGKKETTYADKMMSARFCIVPRGDTPTTRHLFDAIVAGCLPIVISDAIDANLPFSDVIPYADFWFRVKEKDWIRDPNAQLDAVHNTPEEEVKRRQHVMASYAVALNWADVNHDDGLRLVLEELLKPPKKHLKFVHITKTGGTAIENAGHAAGIEWGRFHKEYGFWHALFSKKPQELRDKYDWFAVVRNPYDRVLSEFHCKWGGVGSKASTYTVTTFNQYVRDRMLNFPQGGNHWTPQHLYLMPAVTVLKFENLKHDFDALMKERGLGIRLNNDANQKWLFNRNDFDSVTLDLIHSVYAKDFLLSDAYTQMPPCNLCSRNWVFILSPNGRTGSTTIMTMLDALPDTYIAGESMDRSFQTLLHLYQTAPLFVHLDHRKISPYFQSSIDESKMFCDLQQYTFDAIGAPNDISTVGWKSIKIHTKAELKFLERVFPCARYILSIRRNTTNQKGSAFLKTKNVSAADLRQQGNVLLDWGRNKDAKTLYLEDNFTVSSFNRIASWLGHQCTYNVLVHDNNYGTYYRGDTNVSCTPH